MMAILLLVLVWALSSLARDLGLAGFVASTIGFLIPRWLVPVAVFAAGAALACFVGSSWGAWGILGAGHVPLLSHLLASSPIHELVDASTYLCR